jgi:phosphatidylinositol alpha-1,6-mannosyltransferase
VRHLLVTNDFPPKVGGIQSYLWELWRRLPPCDTTVLTTPHPGAATFDAVQPFRVERTGTRVMLPTRALRRQIDRLAADVDADLVLLDPALPVGRLGPQLERPYGVVVHGAEVTIPGRVPGFRHELARVLRGARLVIAAGNYPAREAERAARRTLPVAVVPPGIDVVRFRPLQPGARAEHRARWGVPLDARLVVSVSRLVPRKGMDTLVVASARLARRMRGLEVLIAGDGRDRKRLQRLVDETAAPVRLVGRVSDDDLPGLYGCADVFAMLCRNRWFGLEQEGFGIVFLEAAACAVPQVAGRSGGSHEAVDHGVTGLVVDDARSSTAAADAIADILASDSVRSDMAQASRDRVVERFTYDALADRLRAALDRCDGRG